MKKCIVISLLILSCCKSVKYTDFNFKSKNGFYIMIDDDFIADTIMLCLDSDTVLNQFAFPNNSNGQNYIEIEEDRGMLTVGLPGSEHSKIAFNERRNLELKFFSKFGVSDFKVDLAQGQFMYLIVFSYRSKEKDENVSTHMVRSFWQGIFGPKDKPFPDELLMNEDYKRFEVVRLLQSKNEPISD